MFTQGRAIDHQPDIGRPLMDLAEAIGGVTIALGITLGGRLIQVSDPRLCEVKKFAGVVEYTIVSNRLVAPLIGAVDSTHPVGHSGPHLDSPLILVDEELDETII